MTRWRRYRVYLRHWLRRPVRWLRTRIPPRVWLAFLIPGFLLAVGSVTSDRWEDAALYRRVLTYSVDYATTITAAQPGMIVGGTQISPDGQTIANVLG